jgi:predicted nucleic acid-binding protein
MTLAYVDSSVILRHVLGEPTAFRGLDKFEKLYSSSLLTVEVMRTLDRMRIHHQWPDAEVALRVKLYGSIASHVHLVDLTPDVLGRAAAAFPTPIRTSDALHAATFQLLADQLEDKWCFVTHDTRQADAITASGHGVVG